MTDTNDLVAETLKDYRAWLYRTAIAILGPTSPDLDDLVQEGYIAMWRAAKSYDAERGSLASWLTSKARWRMLEAVRREQYRFPATLSLDALRTENQTLADLIQTPGLTEGVELAYHHGEIAAAIAELTPSQRRYVTARFWGGMTHKEMGDKVFGYEPTGLWYSTRGARSQLATKLGHLRNQ